MASWIPGPIFFVIFILDDLLEFGDLVSGGLYTYTALQEGYVGKRDPGCNGMAFVPLIQSECDDVANFVDLACDADMQDGMLCHGSLGFCGTDPNTRMCSGVDQPLYKAVPENCQEHFTYDCATVKKRLAVASVGAMVASVFSSTFFHSIFAEGRFDLVKLELGHQDDEATIKREKCHRTVVMFESWLFPAVVSFEVTLLLLADAAFIEDEEDIRLFPIYIISVIGGFYLIYVKIVYDEGETYYKKATLGRNLFVSSEDQNRWNSAAEMLGRSSYMQVPCLSVVTGCILGPRIDLLENLYSERKYFKLQLRIMQDIPDLIISSIDMYIFDLSMVNLLDLVVSVLELGHYLLPLGLQAVWNCLKKLCKATAERWRGLQSKVIGGTPAPEVYGRSAG